MTTCSKCDWGINGEPETDEYILCGICQIGEDYEEDNDAEQSQFDDEWIIVGETESKR